MSVHTPITRSVRDLALDMINAAETLAQFRTGSLTTADMTRERMAANQIAYFERKDRANASGTAAFALRVEPASPSRPSRLQSTFAGE